MKKLFVVIAFLTISSITFGQFTTITPKIGFTLSSSQNILETNFKPGYLFGVTSAYLITPKFSISPGLLFEQKGFKWQISYVDSLGNISGPISLFHTLNYIILPVQMQFKPFKSNLIYLSAGGYAGFLFSAYERVKGEMDGVDKNIRSKGNVSNYNRWDAGFNFGGGIEVPLNNSNKVNISIQYEISFYDHNYNFLRPKFPPGTNTIEFMVGYNIKTRK